MLTKSSAVYQVIRKQVVKGGPGLGRGLREKSGVQKVINDRKWAYKNTK
jgi:hypothetical protein